MHALDRPETAPNALASGLVACAQGACRCPCHIVGREIVGALDVGLRYLTQRERHLFDLLFADAGHWVSRSHIERTIWGRATRAEGHALATTLHRLQRKLTENDAPWRIGAVQGALCVVPIEIDV